MVRPRQITRRRSAIGSIVIGWSFVPACVIVAS
jgi:hypothetical protein